MVRLTITLTIALLLTACSGFNPDRSSSSLNKLGNVKARAAQSLSLAASNVTTLPFGQGFDKWVYSAALPGQVNFTGLAGSVVLDTNAPTFTEALYTVGYSPSGNCIASGTHYTDYTVLFQAMPDAILLNQWIVKSVGSRVELNVAEDLPNPVTMGGCVFVIMDGSAGAAGTQDTMSNSIQFNYAGGPGHPSDKQIQMTSGEHFPMTSAPDSSTGQFADITAIDHDMHVSLMSGSVANASFDFFNLQPATGDWSTEDYIFAVPQCQGYSGGGNFKDQDFFANIPAGAISLIDIPQSAHTYGMLQQSFAQPLNLDLHAGDCIVHLIRQQGSGAIDLEAAIFINTTKIAAQPTAVPTATAAGGQTSASTAQAQSAAAQAQAASAQATAQAQANATAQANAQAATAQAAAARQTQSVYRYASSSGDHIYALTSTGVGVPAGFSLEGAAFSTYVVAYASTTELLRCSVNGHQFLSVDPGCEGQTNRGSMGFISTIPGANLSALYRSAGNGLHFESTSATEGTNAGYTMDGVLGYVP